MNPKTYSANPLLCRIFFLSLAFPLFLGAVLHGSLLTAHAARNVSFTWNANPEAVDGYKLYYKVGTSGPPYNGTGAAEGSSPVATGNVTSFTLHGLSETETYYFVLTAYKGTLESSYTQEVILAPVAAGNILPIASDASFSTSENSNLSATLSAIDPDGDPLTYTIIRNGSLGRAVISNPSTGAFTYTPFPGVSGNDAFSFKANDGTGDSNTATVNILITALNKPPTAVISSSASVGEAPLLVRFDGTASADSDGTITSYTWDFGDGKTAAGAVVSHTYSAAGTYSAKLTVTDNSNNRAFATTPIVVTAAGNLPPLPVISVSSADGPIPLPVTFDATGSYDPDGSIVSYSWNFDDGTTAAGSSVNHVFTKTGIYNVILRVTDNQGASSPLAYTITAQAESTLAENKKFPWDLFLPVINRNAALRKGP